MLCSLQIVMCPRCTCAAAILISPATCPCPLPSAPCPLPCHSCLQEFQRRVADIVAMPWQLAISEDSKWPVAEANYQVPRTAALLRPYFGAVAKAAAQDLRVFVQWAQVLHMVAPPTAFFSPFMVLAALRHGVLLPLLARLPWVGARFAAPAAPGARAVAVVAGEQRP